MWRSERPRALRARALDVALALRDRSHAWGLGTLLDKRFGEEFAVYLTEAGAALANPPARLAELVDPDVGSKVTQSLWAKATGCEQTIEFLVSWMENAQGGYPLHRRQQTRRMITRFRKLYYDGIGWNAFLIPRARCTRPLLRTQEQREAPVQIAAKGAPPFEVIRRHTAAPQVRDDSQIENKREVRLADGRLCDIGHVLCGLDARNHAGKVNGPLWVDLSSNLAAVTWLGDVGSVVAEIVFDALRCDRAVPASRVQQIVDEFNPGQDMLGNMDAYLLGRDDEIGMEAYGPTVPKLFRSYYLADHDPPPRTDVQRFASRIGLGYWNGNIFSNELEWQRAMATETAYAAAMYAGMNTRGLGRIWISATLASNAAVHQLSCLLLRLLLDALHREMLKPDGETASGGTMPR
jgi:hypothetical protein